MDGYFGSLKPAQEKSLQDFVTNIQKLNAEIWKYDLSKFDTYDYLRFLRARKFNVSKSVEMFSNYIKWRIEFGLDQIYVKNYLYSSYLNFQKKKQ